MTAIKSEPIMHFANVYPLVEQRTDNFVRELWTLMSNHYGPYSRFAVLDDPAQPLEEPNFTTDGINILSSVRATGRQEQLVLKMLTYIGRKIDHSTGDGTTTGILLAIHLLSQYTGRFEFSSVFRRPYPTIKRIMAEVLKDFSERYEDALVRLEDLVEDDVTIEDVRAGIAYFQAYTSSHGDSEIAWAVCNLFRLLPEEALDSISFEQTGREQKDRVSIKQYDAQYNCKSDLLTMGMLDKEANSLFHSTSSRVMLLYNGIIDNTAEYYEVEKQIVEAFKTGKDLTVLAPSACGVTRSRLISFIKATRKDHLDHADTNVGVFFPYSKLPNINDTVIISLLGGIESPNPTLVDYLENVDVVYTRGEVLLSNLYQEPAVGNLRPHYRNPDYPMFNTMYDDLTKVMEKYKEANNDGRQTDHLKELIRLKNLMLLDRRVSLVIGGTSYENVSLYDVIQDCVTASRKSLREGFVPGMMSAMPYGFTRDEPMFIATEDDRTKAAIVEAFKEAANAVQSTLMNTIPSHLRTSTDFTNLTSDIRRIKHNLPPVELYILQPKQTDIEILRRVEEVLFKYMHSTLLINA